MDIWDYFPPHFMKLLFRDIKIIDSPRAKARLFYSERFNQIIYIKNIDFKRSISEHDFFRRQNGGKERMLSDALRRMQQLCGQKKGYKNYSKAYKLLIIIAPNISKKIYRHLWAYNRLCKSKYQKTMFEVFENSNMPECNIAGAVYGILYKQYHGWYDICKKSLKEKNVQPFGHLRIKMQDLEYLCEKVYHEYYRLSSRDALKKKYRSEMKNLELNIIVHNLGNPELSSFEAEV